MAIDLGQSGYVLTAVVGFAIGFAVPWAFAIGIPIFLSDDTAN